jgi:RNA polymerase sigma-70 factor, ECF subfamily
MQARGRRAPETRHKAAFGVVMGGVEPAGEIALTSTGSGACFESLFQEHYPRIVGMLARLTNDRGQAEEIAADVFCKLSRRSTLFQQGESLAPWIYRVATNAGLDAWRSNARRRRREQSAHAEDLRLAAPGGALDDILREERCARVRTVLAELKPRDAQLLLLRANGLAYRELAETLGIHANSVGTLLARAEAEFERRYRACYGEEL